MGYIIVNQDNWSKISPSIAYYVEIDVTDMNGNPPAYKYTYDYITCVGCGPIGSPSAPNLLSANYFSTTGCNRIEFTEISEADFYKVYRCLASDEITDFDLLEITDAHYTQYNEEKQEWENLYYYEDRSSDLIPGVSYKYAVAGVNQSGEGTNSNSRTVTYGTLLSGSTVLTGTQTLNGAYYTYNNVIIAGGANITMNPGVRFAFYNGASLISYGLLNAIGTEENHITFKAGSGTTPDSWGNIELNGSGADGSTIQYVNINYGNGIRVVNVPNYRISFCSFLDNYIPIYAINTSGYGIITYNAFSSNSLGHTIEISNSNATFYGNVISKHGTGIYSGAGIQLNHGSYGKLFRNDISYCNRGVSVIWGSSSDARKVNANVDELKNNRIRNCTSGLVVYRDSYARFGADKYWNGNSIYDNTYYNALVGTTYPEYDSYLYAGNCWWGSSQPDMSKFAVGSNSYFSSSPYLTSDPWETMSKASVGNDIQIAEYEANEEPIDLSGFDKESLEYCYELINQGKFTEAMNSTLSFIKTNPDNQAAYVCLYNCYSKETANSLISYFNDLPSKASSDHKLLLANLYLKQEDYKSAKKVNKQIIGKNKNTSLAVRANLNNLLISLYNEDNTDEAFNILSDAVKKSKLSTSYELSDAAYAIESYARVHKKSVPGLAKLQQELQEAVEVEAKEEMPTDYNLIGNYPNPFNPSTTIKYSLPYNSSVKLTVYNIMGQEIKSFEMNSQSAGTHSVVWDGRNANGIQVASGIYLYRVSIKSLENSEVFEKTAKMLMLK